MSSNYDNWEKLVKAVLKREQYRRLALYRSISSSSSISDGDGDGDVWSFSSSRFDHHLLDVGQGSQSTFIRLRFLFPDQDSRSDSPVSRSTIGSGKKCYMVGAKELGIIWCGDTPRHWDLTSHQDSRFSEVAQLKSVCWLEIRRIINTRMLSTNTIYRAYLVFKLEKMSYALESANAFARFMNDKLAEGGDGINVILGHFSRENGEVPVRSGDGLTEIAKVHLQLQRRTQSRHQQQQTGRLPMQRDDGLMEMEMGSFYSDGGDDGAVEAWLLGTEGYSWKSDLIVQGIEFWRKPLYLSNANLKEANLKMPF